MTPPAPTPPGLADADARREALTRRDAALWVEAGAGSGKTALMAGRVVLLVADGVPPGRIAAITFTELAAAQLADRIHDLTTRLLDGEVPVELDVALPNGLTAERRAHLTDALARLDDLTATTIHGFAFELIRPYPVEANLDPGAAPMDEAERALLQADVVDAWLRERLGDDGAGPASGAPGVPGSDAASGPADEDVVAVLALEHGSAGIDWLLELAEAADSDDDAHVPSVDPAVPVRALRAFERAIDGFAAAARGLGGEPPGKTADILRGLHELAGSWRAVADRPLTLAARAVRDRDGPAFTQAGGLRARSLTKKDAAAAARTLGRSQADADAAYATCTDAYEVVKEAFDELARAAADLLLAEAMTAVADLAERYAQRKRASARLDFDDLLRSAVRLLRIRPEIRDASAQRYRHLLVDEFQDTDPRQAEIVWRITGVPPATNGVPAGAEGDWRDWPARGDARFVVGDPKQSIYRFRRADVRTYLDLRERHETSGAPLLSVTTNFRSRPGILDATNAAFEEPLGRPGQPGYEPLVPFREDDDLPALARLRLATPDGLAADATPSAGDVREIEARAVAGVCARLIGGEEGVPRGPIRASEIALLAPVGTELWRYERALEAHGVAVASQAGKGFYGRQEVQDLVALARALAHPGDVAALGALLRGPLVGATDEELLDVAQALHGARDEDERVSTRLTLRTDPALVPVGGVRRVLAELAPLQNEALGRTPHQTLAAAIDRLEVRAIVRQRYRGQAARALANVERFLDGARAWSVRGLDAFARDAYRRWKDEERALEGRPSAEENAVTLITVHSAKGLEWDVVVPINTHGAPRGADPPHLDRRDGRLAHRVRAASSSGFDELADLEAAESEAEDVRLLYVAATRAKDLLVVPRPDWPVKDGSWLARSGLHDLDGATIDLGATAARPVVPPSTRAQDAATFAAQKDRIAAVTPTIDWTSPSRHDAVDDRAPVAPPAFDDVDPSAAGPMLDEGDVAPEPSARGPEDDGSEARDGAPVAGRGRMRGLVLHALMEALVTGEVVPDDLEAYAAAATDALLSTRERSGAEADTGRPDPAEMAAVARRAWEAPALADVRADLRAEVDLYGRDGDAEDAAWVRGVADAVAVDGSGRSYLVIDWKSDVDPGHDAIELYREQVRAYLRLTGVERGRLVFLTGGQMEEVDVDETPP